MLAAIYTKIRNRERISEEEGLLLLSRADLLDLAETANEIRFEKNSEPQVTFVVDSNPNYTNICENNCVFCAFRRHAGEEEINGFSYENNERLGNTFEYLLSVMDSQGAAGTFAGGIPFSHQLFRAETGRCPPPPSPALHLGNQKCLGS